MSRTKKTVSKILESYVISAGKGKAVFVVFFGVILAFLGAVEPLIFTQIIKLIESYITSGDIAVSEIVIISIIWGIYTIIFIVLSYIFDYFFLAKTIIKNYHEQSLYYANRIVQMSFGHYLGKQVGSMYKILDRGTENQLFFLYTLLLGVLRSSTQIIIISVILFIVDWRMAIATLALVPIAVGIGSYIYLKVGPTQKKLDQTYANGFAIIGNGLSNFGLTKILNLEEKFYAKMRTIFDDSYTKQLKVNRGWSLAHGYTAAVVIISRILVISLGFFLITQGEITFATLFLFFSYIGWIYFPLSFLFEQLRQFQKYLTAVELMHEEFDNIDFEDINSGKILKNIQGNITFDNVSFGYTANQAILKKIHFSIYSGQKIALVGNTGAGKSTIINLILRFWDISEGKILLDGYDISSIKKSSLRSHIGVVSQDSSLFNLSIEENLKFANPKATQKQIKQALIDAEAQFVFDLDDGIKTVIGERGLKLSGGEKQRISIARLFLKNPEILLLDEATSALDNLTEKKIEKALNRLMKGKTSIIIAHRLSTIKNADMIYVLEKGKIIEQGNYKTLMTQKGKFYSLANPEKLILG